MRFWRQKTVRKSFLHSEKVLLSSRKIYSLSSMKHFHGKILVTGGAGFVGSALVWALNKRGLENILITDHLGETEKFKNLIPLRFDDYMEADTFLKQLHESPKLFKDIETIFHLGACSSTTEKNARYLIQNNYGYTQTLAKWAVENDMRFVYASSAATYGDKLENPHAPYPLSSLRPLNMYGYSKHLFDLWAERQGLLKSIVGLKYFNVFGPNEYHKGEMQSVVRKAFYQIKETGAVTLFKSDHPKYKDGEQKRDFLYVKDAVEMTLHLAENKKENGLYNIGSGKAHTWLALVTPIFEAMEVPVQINFSEIPKEIRSKYQYFTQAVISRLQESQYPLPITPLREAVTDYVKNYLIPGKHLGEDL